MLPTPYVSPETRHRITSKSVSNNSDNDNNTRTNSYSNTDSLLCRHSKEIEPFSTKLHSKVIPAHVICGQQMLSVDTTLLNQPPLAGTDFAHCSYARAMRGPSTFGGGHSNTQRNIQDIAVEMSFKGPHNENP